MTRRSQEDRIQAGYDYVRLDSVSAMVRTMEESEKSNQEFVERSISNFYESDLIQEKLCDERSHATLDYDNISGILSSFDSAPLMSYRSREAES
ncbi:MAG: hypothetical protein EZS28_014633 [Streblomastix strix]|uniref:Uncharacterized protein n=1 Tax=Streblomastix strix TaxID=222440 RepID=A0A5J4W5B6_9EUKA|nr:MAG: hypothetical protein EZS28_014633 [Streblomastix strix]